MRLSDDTGKVAASLAHRIRSHTAFSVIVLTAGLDIVRSLLRAVATCLVTRNGTGDAVSTNLSDVNEFASGTVARARIAGATSVTIIFAGARGVTLF